MYQYLISRVVFDLPKDNLAFGVSNVKKNAYSTSQKKIGKK